MHVHVPCSVVYYMYMYVVNVPPNIIASEIRVN